MAPPRTSASQGARPAPWLWVALGVVCLGAIIGIAWLGGPPTPAAEGPLQDVPSGAEPTVDSAPETATELEPQLAVATAPAPAEPTVAEQAPGHDVSRRIDAETGRAPSTVRAGVVLDLRWTRGSHVPPKERSRRWLPRHELVVDADSFRAALEERRRWGNAAASKDETLVVEVVRGPDRGRSVRGSTRELVLTNLQPALSVVEVRTSGGEIVSRRTVDTSQRRLTRMAAQRSGSWPTLEVLDWEGDPVDGAFLAALDVRGDGRASEWRREGRELPMDLEPLFLLEVGGTGIARLTTTERIHSRTVGPIRLEQAAPLDVRLLAPDHEGQAVTVWVQNAGEPFAPRAHREELATVVGETPLRFDELSPGDVWIVAIAHRPYPAVGLVRRTLVAGLPDSVLVTLTPTRALEGRVHVRGVPAAGMAIELWCSRPLAVSAAYLGRPADVYENEVLPLFPPAYQRVTTDGEGRFLLADWPELDDEHWLEVLRPLADPITPEDAAWQDFAPFLAALGYAPATTPKLDPVLYALRVPKDRRVFDIDLAGPPPNVPKGALRLRLFGADAAAKVHVRCDGQAESEHKLEGNTLLLGPLARGTWTATVTVGGVVWLEPTEINLQGVFDLEVEAPDGSGG